MQKDWSLITLMNKEIKNQSQNNIPQKSMNRNATQDTNNAIVKKAAVNNTPVKKMTVNNTPAKKTAVNNTPAKKNTVKNTSVKKTNVAGNIKRKKKKRIDEVIRKGFKRTSGFMFRLLVNLIIIFIVISIFSYAFNFAYSVFGDTAKDPDSSQYVIVEVSSDSSILNIGEALEDAGIIDDKYVFYAKVKLKGYSNSIRSGKYGLSASMDFEEIMQIICEKEEEN